MLQRLGKSPEPKQTDAQREVSFYRESLAFSRCGEVQQFVCELIGPSVIRSNEVELPPATDNSKSCLAGSVLASQDCRPFQGIPDLRRRVTQDGHQRHPQS